MYDTNLALATATTNDVANDTSFVFEPKRCPLTVAQMQVLFEKLSEDDAYRTLFVNDIQAAFALLPGSPIVPMAMTPGTCFRPNNLASKDVLRAARKHVVMLALSPNPFIPQMLEA